MVIFIFGLCGSGKTYVGERIAKYYSYDYVEGDSYITPSMKELIDKGEKVTSEARQEYMNTLQAELNKFVSENKFIVISQALYRNEYRIKFKNLFPDIRFIEVRADDDLCYQRIAERNDWITVEKAQKIRGSYEDPRFLDDFTYTEIMNTNKINLSRQISELNLPFATLIEEQQFIL